MLPRRIVVLFFVSGFATLAAVEPPPPWAYGFKEPPPPGTQQVPPGKAASPSTDPVKYGLPGTDRQFTRAEIMTIFSPADYFPDEHPTPPERRRSMYHRVHPGRTRVERKPETTQRPCLGPERRTPAIVSGDMLGQRGEEDIPTLISHRGGFGFEQGRTPFLGLPAVILQELGDVTPPFRLIGCGQEHAEPFHR